MHLYAVESEIMEWQRIFETILKSNDFIVTQNLEWSMDYFVRCMKCSQIKREKMDMIQSSANPVSKAQKKEVVFPPSSISV